MLHNPGLGMVVALVALMTCCVFYIIGMPRNGAMALLLAFIVALFSAGGLR